MKQKTWLTRDNTTAGEYAVCNGKKPTVNDSGFWVETGEQAFLKEMSPRTSTGSVKSVYEKDNACS